MDTNILKDFIADAVEIRIIVNIFFGIISGVFISLGYAFGNREKSFSKSFVVTLLLLPAVVAVVIPLIATDLKKALSLAGIFALVRFRSTPGDAKDIFYIFFTLTVGVAIALNYYIVAIVLLIVVSVLFIILMRYIRISKDELLKITIPEDMNYSGTFDDIFEKYLNKAVLSEVRTSNMGTLFTLSYKIQQKNNMSTKEMIDEIRTRNGNLNVVIQIDPELYLKL